MATPAEIAAKHAEFQTAIADLENATADYEAKKTPYLVAKQTLIDTISRLDEIDDELEAMTTEYEPPVKPGDA